MATLIEDAVELVGHAAALKALGYSTLEQVVGTVDATSNELAAYLNIDSDVLRRKFVRRPEHQEQLTAAAKRPLLRSFGVRLDRVPPPRFALMRAPGTQVNLPLEVNLIGEMAAIRDQAERGTCVAHAATAVAEHYWRTTGQIVDMSRQFLYWDCKQHDGDPAGEGTWVAVAMARLVADGCCKENTWPYNPVKNPANESQDPPPASAIVEAGSFKIPSFQQLTPTSVYDIKSELARQRCVAFSIPVFDSWVINTTVEATGEIQNPIPNEAVTGGHAMCLVGYKDDAQNASIGGGKFYVRNSWDSTWGTASVLGTVGYGTIPYSYIAAYCAEAYSIK